MTKKDFELIARVIENSPSLDNDQKFKLAKEMAHALWETNPRFDERRFIRAAIGNPYWGYDAEELYGR